MKNVISIIKHSGLILLLSVICNSAFSQLIPTRSALEMSPLSSPGGIGPTVSPQVVTMRENIDNPAGLDFDPFTSPTTTVTFSLIDQKWSLPASQSSTETGVMFGGTKNTIGLGSDKLVNSTSNFLPMDAISVPLSGFFTSYNSHPNTGITVLLGNSATSVFTSANALNHNNGSSSSITPTNGRAEMATLKVDFSRAVNNPIIHLVGLGGEYVGTLDQLGFATELELQTPGVTLTRLSGTPDFTVDATKKKILNTNAHPNSLSPLDLLDILGLGGAASGSVKVNGTAITSLEFKVFLRGDGGKAKWTSTFGSSVLEHNGDQWLIGASLDVPGSISGNVGVDDDNDDVKDTNKSGVTVTLYNDVNSNGLYDTGTDTQVAVKTTDSNGNYSFTGVAQGNYVVVETDPVGFVSVSDNDISADNGSDGDPEMANPNTNDNTIFVSIDAGESDKDNNFIDEQHGTITGTVSIDSDFNETGDAIPPAPITLILYNDVNANGIYDAGDTQVTTTTTDVDGDYIFSDVPSGNYIVYQTNLTNYYSVSDASTIDGSDIANTNTNNSQVPVTIAFGEEDDNNNFVDTQGTSTISGTVFQDHSNNNQLDKDLGVGGINVELLEGLADFMTARMMAPTAGENLLATTTTASDGTYSFQNVPPGDYIITLGPTVVPRQFDNDDSIDGINDTEENNMGGGTTSGRNTTDGRIPVSIIGGGASEVDGNNNFIISDFTNGTAPLPVILLSFEAMAKENSILLDWVTTEEKGNLGFEILHSVDAKQFASIGFLEGKMSANELTAYRFEHDSPVFGQNYYQLHQYDYNNSVPIKSKIVGQLYTNKSGLIVSYPNPTSSEMWIKGVKKGDKVNVYGSNGTLYIQKEVTKDNESEINMDSLKDGLYNLIIQRNGLNITANKIIKK